MGVAKADRNACVAIENDLDRLACYDTESGRTPLPQKIKNESAWDVEVTNSDFDDSTKVFLNVESEKHSGCRYDKAKFSLYLACRENTTSLWIHFGGCFMSDNRGRGTVDIRLDKEPAFEVDMRESNNNKALGLWNGGTSIPIIREMYDNDVMLIRATPHSENTVTATFPIGGLKEAVRPLAEACNWQVAEPGTIQGENLARRVQTEESALLDDELNNFSEQIEAERRASEAYFQRQFKLKQELQSQ